MYEQKLKQAGYKITRPRQAVLAYLEAGHEPSSASTIHQKIINIDLVSVYRTLKLFEELGFVQKDMMAGEERYYLAKSQHHHITCIRCGHIKCVPCDHVFEKIKGFSNIKHQLILTGFCSQCNK